MIRTLELQLKRTSGKAYIPEKDTQRLTKGCGLDITRMQIFIDADSTQTSPVAVWLESHSNGSISRYTDTLTKELNTPQGSLLTTLPFTSPSINAPLSLDYEIKGTSFTSSIPTELNYSLLLLDVQTGESLDFQTVFGTKGFINLTFALARPLLYHSLSGAV